MSLNVTKPICVAQLSQDVNDTMKSELKHILFASLGSEGTYASVIVNIAGISKYKMPFLISPSFLEIPEEQDSKQESVRRESGESPYPYLRSTGSSNFKSAPQCRRCNHNINA
jgi:hypothetical protein